MTTDNLGELAERIRHLARVPNLLVACDYDGTLAPLVDDPMKATPNRDSVAAMRSLAELANTHVTVISGRSLRDLATLSRLPEEIRLVGSHGSEFDLGFSSQLDPTLAERRENVVSEVRALGRKYGAIVEEKPAGVTYHFRSMSEDRVDAAREELVRGPALREGVFVRNGHEILEFSVIDTNKGEALETIRHQVGASAVVYVGDDTTDEDGFRTLTGPDVGVKVGEAKTAAGYRVADTDTVAQILALLAELRGRWLRGEGLIPIEDHSILSDLRTAAIVTPEASISWLCVPRIDSGAVFAQLLGGPSAGHFTVRDGNGGPVAPTGQRYLANSMVLGIAVLDLHRDRLSRLVQRPDPSSGGPVGPDPDPRRQRRSGDRVRSPARFRPGSDPAGAAGRWRCGPGHRRSVGAAGPGHRVGGRPGRLPPNRSRPGPARGGQARCPGDAQWHRDDPP